MKRQKELSQKEDEMEGAGWEGKAKEFVLHGETEFTGSDPVNQQAVLESIHSAQLAELHAMNEGEP